LQNGSKNPKLECGWALGIGLDRWAMQLFDIPDIRLLWSEDERFIQQFKEGAITKFKKYSDAPACVKDLTMWMDGVNENDMYDLIRSVGGCLVESVKCIDSFKNKSGQESRCYRIMYRHAERSLTN